MTKVDREVVTDAAVVGRIEAVRANLPYQAGSVLSRAEAQFGLSYTREALEQEITARMPWKWRHRKAVNWTGVRVYEGGLPDKALLALAEAIDSGLFVATRTEMRWPSHMPAHLMFNTMGHPQEAVAVDDVNAGFHVLTPQYVRRERPRPAPDPWLVGQVKGTQRYVVLAYWD